MRITRPLRVGFVALVSVCFVVAGCSKSPPRSATTGTQSRAAEPRAIEATQSKVAEPTPKLTVNFHGTNTPLGLEVSSDGEVTLAAIVNFRGILAANKPLFTVNTSKGTFHWLPDKPITIDAGRKFLHRTWNPKDGLGTEFAAIFEGNGLVVDVRVTQSDVVIVGKQAWRGIVGIKGPVLDLRPFKPDLDWSKVGMPTPDLTRSLTIPAREGVDYKKALPKKFDPSLISLGKSGIPVFDVVDRLSVTLNDDQLAQLRLFLVDAETARVSALATGNADVLGYYFEGDPLKSLRNQLETDRQLQRYTVETCDSLAIISSRVNLDSTVEIVTAQKWSSKIQGRTPDGPPATIFPSGPMDIKRTYTVQTRRTGWRITSLADSVGK
jgi:hypothetical protein